MHMKKNTRDAILTVITNLLSLLPLMWWIEEMERIEGIYYPNASGATSFQVFILSLLALLIWYVLHIIIHEAGHMVAGLLGKYTFVSFRIGRLTLVNEFGKLTLKKTFIQGTAGQCLMCPPKCDPETYDPTWYLLGGSMANLFIASLCMYIYAATENALAAYYLCFLAGIMGLVLCIQNLLPMKLNGLANDGYNIFLTGKNKKAKQALYYVLVLNAKMAVAENINQISDQLVSDVLEFEYDDMTNIYEANLCLIAHTLFLAKEMYIDARICCEKVYTAGNMRGILKNEALCGLLYYEFIGPCREGVIITFFDKKIRKYIKSTACYPFRKMLMYAYYAIYKHDEAQALRELCDLKALAETYPVKMETCIALREVEGLKARLDTDFSLVYNSTNGDKEKEI